MRLPRQGDLKAYHWAFIVWPAEGAVKGSGGLVAWLARQEEFNNQF